MEGNDDAGAPESTRRPQVFREQARSYSGMRIPVGARLAREGVNENAALLALELRLTLGNKRRHPFLLILRRKRRMEHPTLKAHTF